MVTGIRIRHVRSHSCDDAQSQYVSAPLRRLPLYAPAVLARYNFWKIGVLRKYSAFVETTSPRPHPIPAGMPAFFLQLNRTIYVGFTMRRPVVAATVRKWRPCLIDMELSEG